MRNAFVVFKPLIFFLFLCFTYLTLFSETKSNINSYKQILMESAIELSKALKISLAERKDIPKGKIVLLSQQNKNIKMGAFQMLINEEHPYPKKEEDIINVDILDSKNKIVARGIVSHYISFEEAKLNLLTRLVHNSMPMEMVIAGLKLVNDVGDFCIEKQEYNWEKKVFVPVYYLVRASTAVKLTAVPGTTNLLEIVKELDKAIINAAKENASKKDDQK